MKRQLLILFLVVSLFACEKEILYEDQFSELEPFDQIEINDAFEVFLEEDSYYAVRISGDEKNLEHVGLKVEDNKLIIENSRKGKWISPSAVKTEIYISSLPLYRIYAADGCNIQTLNPITSNKFGLILKGKANQASLELDCNEFHFWNDFPCGGKLTLWGETERLRLSNYALMSVDAKNLSSKSAVIKNSSKGDCEVRVLNKLEYSIFGTGNIHLYGTPLEIIENDLSSSGQLIQHE